MTTLLKFLSLTADHDSVPQRYRGVWRRDLLEAPDERDTSTTVYWLQAGRWHADIRIPDKRPSFAGIDALASCNARQLAWLATQQGFAGVTQVEQQAEKEICTWHRIVDFQPPAATPDAGYMAFRHDKLLETGVHGSYSEEWHRLPGSTDGSIVLARLDSDNNLTEPLCLLLVAGNYVMRVNSRAADWPDQLVPGTAFGELLSGEQPQWLDFEISFGRRTAQGWTVLHSTLPYLEGRTLPLRLERRSEEIVRLSENGVENAWRVLEWSAPELVY